jgi:hypothetical protein
MTSRQIRFVLAATAGIAALSWNGELSPTAGGFSTAHAIIGRPLTPMSYAGVARRTTYRAAAARTAAVATTAAVASTAAVVAAAPPAVVVGPTCVQVVNAYGQVTYRC